jgi:Gas vesicle synthesis protein GvpL/GvpF
VPDERLRRWAAERAPELIERAEEEALAEVRAMLREALVEAALETRAKKPEAKTQPAARAPKEEPPAPRSGEARWVYAVARQDATPPGGALTGVGDAPVRPVVEGGLAAIVSPVPLPEFGEEMLTESLNDLGWLEGVARAHPRVIDEAFERGPVVPLRLCTIYETDDGVRELLREDGRRFGELLEALDGREEWSVKLFVDPDRLEAEAAGPSDDDPAEASLGAGGAYLAKRKADRTARQAADRLAGEIADEVHARLQDWASDATVGRPQNPELSGHSGQMLLNGAYLVESERSERFAQLVDELQERYSGLGARLEISGPWPPYNFISER